MAAGLRLATWNIHKGIGTDRRYEIERTMAILSGIDADVVCLQEVDEHVPRSSFHRQARLIADSLGYRHVAVGLNVRVRGGHYGNVTLSRFPVRDAHNVDLTIRPKKRRSGLVTRILGPDGRPYVVGNVHLGLLHLERAFQMRALLRHLRDASGEDEALVIAGDTNDWGNRIGRPLERKGVLRVAREAHHRSAGPRTFPSSRPLAALDKIFLRPSMKVLAVTTVLDERTAVASDHLPLVADLSA